MESSKNHYELLGVSKEVNAEQLRYAFRKRSKALHPDTTALPPDQALKEFQQLRDSYELLADPNRRKQYDDELLIVNKLQTPNTASKDPWRGVGERRPLSGGEWFSLLMLAMALMISLLVGLFFGLGNGKEWQVSPSWLTVENDHLKYTSLKVNGKNAFGEHTAQSTFNSSY